MKISNKIKSMKKMMLFLIMPFFVACNDDFLEKKPLDKLSEEAVFASAQLMEQYVNALYDVVPHPFTEGSLAACTDEAYFRFGGTSCNRISRGELTADNVIFESNGGTFHNLRMTFLPLWSRIFPYLRNMNVFLERVDDAAVDDLAKKRLKGEVLFLRAWTYSNMLVRYSGIPIIDKPFQLGDEYNATRDNFDDCVTFIIKDLDDAILLLDNKSSVRGRVGADACRALKARTYLHAASPLFNDPQEPTGGIFKGKYDREKWKLARDAAKNLIDLGGYALAPVYEDHWTNINSGEVIWGRFFDATTTTTSQGLYNAQLYYAPEPEGLGGWNSCKPVENLVADYEMAATGKKPFEDGSGYDPENPWAERDPRFYQCILTPGTVYMGKTIRIASPAPGYTASNDLWYAAAIGTEGTGYWLRKWVLEDETVSESINTTRMYPWFRLAEIYLIYAEAALEYNDDVAACAEYINKIRDRADVKMPFVDDHLSPADMRKKLIQERRIELAFENHRYFDLRRWKLAPIYEGSMIYGITALKYEDGSVTYNIAKPGANGAPDFSAARAMLAYRNFEPQHYLMPVPSDEVRKSEGLIVQNPNY